MGQYEILRELGSGSFGTVYLGRGEIPRKGAGRSKTQLVAIKQLRDASDREALRALEAEFELLDQVMHRSLCKVYQFLEDDNAVVMEAVEGVTLREVMDTCSSAAEPIKTEAAIEIGCELADALYQSYSSIGRNGEALHLVHRDLKPENIMITPSGEVKILDFGLAKVRRKGKRKRERGLKGTPLYMAPEQAAGRSVDHRTDLFAVGLILYELLMDGAAYQIKESGTEDPVAEVMRRIERADLRDEVRAIERRLPGPGPVVSRCLAASPRARYQNGHELMLDLRRELYRDRGAYLGEFCDYFFHNLCPVEPLDAGPPTANAAGPPSGRGATDSRRAEPMANNKGGPPRPGGGPPRPGGRRGPARPGGGGGGARRGPPGRPAGGGPPGPRGPGGPPGRGGPPGPPGRRGPPGPRPPTPPGRGGPPEPDEEEFDNAKSGSETGMLAMTPLSGGDDDYDDNEPPKSATQFFSIPKSKKSAKKPKPPGPAPALGASGGGRSLPPGASSGIGVGGPPPAMPGGPPPAIGQAPPGAGAIGGPVAGGMGAPMAISGPIASGPTAGGNSGGERSPFQVGQAPTGQQAAPEQRARSFRIYAIILALFFMCFLAMVSAVLVVVVGSQYVDDGAVAAADDDDDKDKKKKKKKQKEPEDTASDDGAGAAAPAPPPPPPRRSAPRPRSSSGGSSGGGSASAGSSRSRGSSAPPGSIKVTVQGSTFLAVEIKCPSGDRKRAAFSGGTATAQGIPSGQDCELHFKGGAPVKFRPVRSGNAYTCNVQGSTAVCK